jgi:hypothetical protein
VQFSFVLFFGPRMAVREDAGMIMNYEVMASLASWNLRRYQASIYSFTGVFFWFLGKPVFGVGSIRRQGNNMNALGILSRQLTRGT